MLGASLDLSYVKPVTQKKQPVSDFAHQSVLVFGTRNPATNQEETVNAVFVPSTA